MGEKIPDIPAMKCGRDFEREVFYTAKVKFPFKKNTVKNYSD